MDLQQICERVDVCNLEICAHSLGFCTERPLFSAEDNKEEEKKIHLHKGTRKFSNVMEKDRYLPELSS